MTNQETIAINVSSRNSGKSTSRALRTGKQIPAVVYGPKIENHNFSLSEIDVTKYNKVRFENTIFTLKSSDDSKLNGLQVLRKALSIHPKSRRPVHIDFYAVDMAVEVKVNLEVKYVGKADGVTAGGALQEIRHEIEIECLPTNIPSAIELDVTAIKIGETMHASDIKLPANVKMITPPEIALVSVVETKAEEEPAEAAAPATEAAPAAAATTEKKD